MNRLEVVLAVLVLLVLSQACQAADSQAGWYADFCGVLVYIPGTVGPPDYGRPRLVGSAIFNNTPPGTYGPFQVSDGPYHENTRRIVSVPVDVHNVGHGQSITLPIDLMLGQGARIAYLSVAWQTNYDLSQMYIDLWQKQSDGIDNQVWSQLDGGLPFGNEHILYDTVIDGSYYFRLTVVPEPASIITLLLGITGLVSLAKRRR